jgi:choline dehydrogenase
MTEATVESLSLSQNPDGIRATGVKLLHKGQRLEIQAAKEVLLAAGAVASPQLLQLSGIGPQNELQSHSIAVRHNLDGVGQNLQDHLQIRTIYQVDNTVTLNERARTPWGMAMMGLEYFLKKTGPLTMPPSQLGAFAKSDPSQPSANIEWHVQPLSLDKFGSPLHRYNAITPSVCNLRPSSRGTVSLKSANPHDAPAIAPNYLSTQEDLDVAVAGLRFTRDIMAAPALAPFNPRELKPGPQITTEDELQRAAGDLGTTIFHPVGTCKMGPAHDNLAVVDDQLRVHGVAGLRVIDASIMPTITSGNTNAPTVMIAERGAEFIRKDYRHTR